MGALWLGWIRHGASAVWRSRSVYGLGRVWLVSAWCGSVRLGRVLYEL